MDYNYAEYSGRSDSHGAFLYTVASGEFFETLERSKLSGVYLPTLQSIVPDSWILRRGGLWHHGMPRGSNLPPNGFKLHVSATLDNAKEVLNAVIPVCVENNIVFKVLQAATLLAVANSKFFPRSSAHKFVTIYPETKKQFLEVAERLCEATEDLAGPYILSDLPVKESKIVFYRYGGFLPNSRITVQGTKRLYIKNPKGQWVPDQRVPYFLLPEGITDPLSRAEKSVPSANIVLNSRYRVKEAITFSNCGGTYLATDLQSGEEVLVKEARPHTTISHLSKWRFFAEDAIVREQKILEKLTELACVPRSIEVFREGEHKFAVQQFIDACPFAQYRAQDSILLAPFNGNKQQAARFCKAYKTVGANLIKAVLAIHRRNIIIGDISPYNILLDEKQRVYLVDFESAWDSQWSSDPDELSSVWMTPGFRPRKKGKNNSVTYKDDWYAVSMVLFSMLLPVNRLNTMKPGAFEGFMSAMVEAALLPGWVPAIIQLLVQGKPIAALKLLEKSDTSSSPAGHYLPMHKVTPLGEPHPDLDQQIAQTISGITRYLLKTCDVKRTDRLWPSDFKVFITNPMSLAYGACGPALYLQQAEGKLPGKIDHWLAARSLSRSKYPPGLYLGLSGVAWVLWKLGHKEQARHALTQAMESELLYDEWGIFYGAAGAGLACLQMYLWSEDEIYLNYAAQIGERLLKASGHSGDGLAWKDVGQDVLKPGYAYGGSGIALFLLYLGQITQRGKFVDAARDALEHEIASTTSEFPDDKPRWAMGDKAGVWSPYWLQGGCGIGSVIIRFFVMLGEGRYLKLAHQVARANYSRFTILPAQFEGLSGIGELMLDMHQITGDSGFHKKARHIAESLLLYAIPKDDGIAFPGRYLSRISNDYGYGSAGVGVFLDRLRHSKPRLLHDLEGLPDEHGLRQPGQ